MEKIAHGLSPRVSRATLARYRVRIISTAIEPLRKTANNAKRIMSIAETAGLTGDPQEARARSIEETRHSIEMALQGMGERRARWITDAEEKTILNELGEPIIVNGKPLTNLDHRALSAHDRNSLSALELQAKIAGVYAEQGAQTTNIQIAILAAGDAPSTVETPSASPSTSIAGSSVIDIGTTR